MNDNFVLETIWTRRSIRKYQERALSEEQIEKLVKMALMAPSARNLQPWQLGVVTDQKLILEFETAIIQHFQDAGDEWVIAHNKSRNNKIFYDAPVVFVISMEEGCGVDVGIMAQNLTLAAKGMGLDSVILGFPRVVFAEEYQGKWAQRFRFPENHVYGISVAVGYGAEDGRSREPDFSKVEYFQADPI